MKGAVVRIQGHRSFFNHRKIGEELKNYKELKIENLVKNVFQAFFFNCHGLICLT